jgi:hypothetical protein
LVGATDAEDDFGGNDFAGGATDVGDRFTAGDDVFVDDEAMMNNPFA